MIELCMWEVSVHQNRNFKHFIDALKNFKINKRENKLSMMKKINYQ